MFKESDLVLEVSKNADPLKWDEGKYLDFYDAFFQHRDYQKTATETALRYFLAGEYSNLTDLAKENYQKNQVIQERYCYNEDHFIKDLGLPGMLSANIDMATGTGKSYVIYAIAVIMLAEKAVDRVLVLTPSVTIERELTKKFKDFAGKTQLNVLLGKDFVPPRIINGDHTITSNCIAVENRDAIYKTQENRNSIIHSLSGKGERTLLLNDEVHHVYYSEMNQWKNFIEDDRKNEIKFKYVLGFTGTAYKNQGNGAANEYMPDVIYRYSLKEAIEQGFVKDILYVDKADMPINDDERWKVILNSHEKIARELVVKCGIRPITIVVTSSKRIADVKAKNFKTFLMNEKNYSKEEADQKVLCVHSGDSAKNDRERLKLVDEASNDVEFIFSVSMLTEGWDVKRVFQIVPDEERAFNSKLLIAQVLGRGLRKPDHWLAEWGTPKVVVFNHERWAPRVKELVDELLDFKKTITVYVDKESEYHFELEHIKYQMEKRISSKVAKNKTFQFLEEGYVRLPSDIVDADIEVRMRDVRNAESHQISYQYRKDVYTIEQVAEEMYQKFEDLPCEEDREKYKNIWSVEKLIDMIKRSLQESGNTKITKKIRNTLISSMNVLFRTGTTYISYDTIPTEFVCVSTKNLPKSSSELSMFLRNRALFYSSAIRAEELDDVSRIVFEQIQDEINGYKHKKIENKYCFKTPQIAVIATGEPEIDFMRRLTDKNVAQHIDAFIKAPDNGDFYEIEYSWRKGTHQQYGMFHPDFFIKKGNLILVVEIKDNGQIRNPDPENYGKSRGAQDHFKNLNQYNEEHHLDLRYKFLFLSPMSYSSFFQRIVEDDINGIMNYNSDLSLKLAKDEDGESL